MRPKADQDRIEIQLSVRLKFQYMMAIFQKVDDGERTVARIRGLVRNRAKAGEARPKVELVGGGFNDPLSLKPAFASVDEAFVVVNSGDLNRFEANV